MSAFDESLGAVPDAVPSADEVLGPPSPDDGLPTTEDVLPPRSSIDNTPPPDGEAVSDLVARSSTGRVLDAFGQGRADGWGMRPLDTLSPAAAAELRENGLLKPYEDWRANSALTVNQALMRPAAAALDAASRANNGFSGLQSATAQAFAEAGRPDLASDILSMPGALFGSLYSPGLATGELERARSLGVIAVGEAGWKGTAAEFAAAEGQGAQGQTKDATASEPGAEAATLETLPDKLRALVKNWPVPESGLSLIGLGKDFVEGLAELLEGAHGDLPVGRPLSPKAVGAFIMLAPEGSVVPRTIGAARELLGIGKDVERGSGELAAVDGAVAAEGKGAGEAPTVASESAAEATAEAPAAASESTVPSAEGGVAAAPEEAAEKEAAAARESAPPSVEGAAPAEDKAAGETAGAPSEEVPTQTAKEAPASTPAAREEAPTPASAAPGKGAVASAIAEDVAQKLIEAGRPAEEARAIGEAVEANYQARAARFDGTKGTAQELYEAERPEISAGTEVTPGLAEAKPVAVLTGDEIAPRSVDLKTLRSAAREWYRRNLAGSTVNSPQLGEIAFTGKGGGKAISASANPLKLRLFPSLPDVLENGKLIASSLNRDRATYPNIVQYHWIEAPVKVDGVTHRVRVNVEEHTDGKIYYNHTLPDQYNLRQNAQAGSPSKPGGLRADGASEASAARSLPGSPRPSAANVGGEEGNRNLKGPKE